MQIMVNDLGLTGKIIMNISFRKLKNKDKHFIPKIDDENLQVQKQFSPCPLANCNELSDFRIWWSRYYTSIDLLSWEFLSHS